MPDNQQLSQFLISAPHSSAGKTTVTLGLLRALKRLGQNPQPFKCGPDYLDPKLHKIASDNNSINLDGYMMDADHIKSLYYRYGKDANVLITEGVMGLYDGAVRTEGSSASIAELLGIPIILVVNAKAMAYSAAALLLGYKSFNKALDFKGVIFNFVERESHYQILKAAAEEVGFTALGFLPENAEIKIPSRHLGLKTEKVIDIDFIIDKAADHIEKHIDISRLVSITVKELTPVLTKRILFNTSTKKRILVANDDAFNFTYAENIDVLKRVAEVSYFSPLNDNILPEADLIYLPGGYPELYLKQLADNVTMKTQIFRHYKNGGKILAECGGMMYLGKNIADEKGDLYPMVGILDLETSMQNKKLTLGYRQISLVNDDLRGHEFHYSQLTKSAIVNENIAVCNARKEPVDMAVYKTGNLLASYMHFYFGDNIRVIEELLFNK